MGSNRFLVLGMCPCNREKRIQSTESTMRARYGVYKVAKMTDFLVAVFTLFSLCKIRNAVKYYFKFGVDG